MHMYKRTHTPLLTHPDVDLGAHVELTLEELGRGIGRAAAARRQRAVRREAVAEAEVWQQQTQHTVQLATVIRSWSDDTCTAVVRMATLQWCRFSAYANGPFSLPS